MKRFLPREFWLMCAPIALFGAGTWMMRALNPPPDSSAKIELSVERDMDYAQPMRNQLNFAWKATARGGPNDNRSIGFSQKLVASGNGKSKVIFSEPPTIKPASFGSNSSNFTQPEHSGVSQDLTFSYDDLPLWTQKLQWRGEVVATPENPNLPGSTFGPVPTASLQQWAQIKGATRVVKQIPIPLDAQQLGAISELKLGKVPFDEAARGADTHISATMRHVERRAFERLVAFDGHTRRELWHQNSPDPYDVRIIQQGDMGRDRWVDFHLFKLRDVPANWGEIVYLVDVVVPPNASKAQSTIPCAASEIARRKKAGWLHFSRRLTVRKNGQTTKAPVFPTTPNTQLLGISTSLSPKVWTIKVRLRYDGTDKTYDLDGDPWFFELDNSSLGFEKISYGIADTAKAGEKLMKITLPAKDLGRPRKVRMKLDIADSTAAPLVIDQILQVPKIAS